MIDWGAFLIVALVSVVSASVLVTLYSLGLRLLSTAGRPPVGGPASFTDAITVVTPAEAEAAAKKARKAALKHPLNMDQKRLALFGGYSCFVLCGLGLLLGIYLIIPALHG